MKSKIAMFFIAFIVWCLFSWVPDWQHLIVGVFVSAFVTFIIGDLFITRPHVLIYPSRYWYFFVHYLPMFLWECIKANLDVAYRVLHPQLPICPGIVKVKVELKTDIALTALANSITLTPGTMSVDIDKENGILYVHWINVKTKDIESATKIIAERFEKVLKKIFD